MRPLLSLLPACALLFAACAPQIEAEPCDSGPCWLQLQSFIDVDASSVSGFVRWLYLAEDPEVVIDSTPTCEIWERLDLANVEPEVGCVGCAQQFEGTLEVDSDDSDCADIDWALREFAFGFTPIADAPDEVATLESQGYTHHVQSRWSPDLGDSEGFQSLFVALPEAWNDGPAGDSGTAVSGEYGLDGLFFWDLRE